MCPRCAAEYADPLDRRFHAQPDACWDCGPHISWVNLAQGQQEPQWGDTREASDAISRKRSSCCSTAASWR